MWDTSTEQNGSETSRTDRTGQTDAEELLEKIGKDVVHGLNCTNGRMMRLI